MVGFTPTHEHQIHLPWSWAQTKHLDNTHVVWLWCVNSVLFLFHVKSALELPLFTQGTFKIQIGGVPNHIELCLTQWLAAQQSHYYTQLKIIKYMGKNVLNAKNVNIHRSIQAFTQMLWKLAATVMKTLCKCLMFKNISYRGTISAQVPIMLFFP